MSKKKNVQAYQAELKEFRKLAKRADQRLRELERLQNQEGFNNVTNWAYRKAMRDIKHWSGEGRTTFNRDAPKNLNSLRAKTRDIENFLNMASSTKTGIMKTYKKRADTLNKRYGTSFNWEDLGNIFDNKEENIIYQKAGGKSYLKAVNYLNQNEKEIMRQLMSGENVTVRTGNAKVNQTVRNILDQYGIEFNELY